MDCFNKAAIFDNHNHIDRVEISSASEASSEVGFGVCCRMEFRTKRTKKSEIVIGIFSWNIKGLTDEDINEDIISQAHQEYWRESLLFHRFS